MIKRSTRLQFNMEEKMKRKNLILGVILSICAGLLFAALCKQAVVPKEVAGQEKSGWKALSVSCYRLGYQESFMEMINLSIIKARLSDAEREFCHRYYERNLRIATERFIKIRDEK